METTKRQTRAAYGWLVVLTVVFAEMSELLFESYCVPRIAHGIDSLFSYYHNAKPFTSDFDALILSCGYQSTHVLPVLGGRLCAAACQRINLGGAAVDGFMLRVLQLKYPQHFAALTLNRAEVSTVRCVQHLPFLEGHVS